MTHFNDLLTTVKDLAMRIQIAEAKSGFAAKRMMVLTLP